MYKALDNFIAHISDLRSGSKQTADSYYRDIYRFIEFLEKNKIDDFVGALNEKIDHDKTNEINKVFALDTGIPVPYLGNPIKKC